MWHHYQELDTHMKRDTCMMERGLWGRGLSTLGVITAERDENDCPYTQATTSHVSPAGEVERLPSSEIDHISLEFSLSILCDSRYADSSAYWGSTESFV